MSKLLRVFPLLLMISIALGGGMVENTNQSAEQIRMMARGASTDLDAVFFNPAGLTKLDNGMHLYLSSQTITQGRTITSDLASLNSDEFEGTTFAPVFPNFYFAYKMDKLVFSAGFVPIGGGGSAVFEDGLPLFEAPVSGIPAALSYGGIPTTEYSFDVNFDGSSTFLGGQASISYAINDMISVSAGARYFQASNSYTGHIKDIKINPTYPGVADGSMISATGFFSTMAALLTGGADLANGAADELQPLIDGGAGSVPFANLVLAGQLPQANVDAIAAGLTALGISGFDATTWTPNSTQIVYYTAASDMTTNATTMSENAVKTQDVEVDSKQTGSGFAPIFGLNINLGEKINIGVRYEMLAPLVLTNETTVDGSGLFPDGAETNADMPALLGIGLSLLVMPSLNIAFDYNVYFNSEANWDGKELYADPGMEFALGAEFMLSDALTLSGGWLYAQSGAMETYQSALSYSLNSNTFGAGLKYTLNPQMAISLGLSNTSYEEGSKEGVYYATNPVTGGPVTGNETYMKTATVFAFGLQKSF